jgi:CubicO group peptidase (beta-lactamase class C family)
MRDRLRVLRALGAVSLILTAALPVAAQRTGGEAPELHPAPLLSGAQLRALDEHIEEVRQQWAVPGLAVAIVQGDSVVFARGYGVKALGNPDRVDENTLFSIGSSGKSMTAAVVAMLVDEGRMRFDDPVWTYLPNFRVADPYVSRHATIRDLLAHRTGLENAIGVWYGSTLTRADLIDQRFRFLEQEVGFRSRMLYNNLMLMTAGEAAAATEGVSFEALMQQRLFAPLGMESTVVHVGQVPAGSNIVAPHLEVDGEWVPVPHRNTQNIGGAGGYYSTARDMAQYLRFQLGNGVHGGDRLVSESSMREMRSVHIAGGQPVILSDDGPTYLGYGLGWFLEYYRGHRQLRHGGAIDGMLTEMMLLPDDQIGVVVLTNRDGHAMHSALTQHIFDVALGLPERDWNGEAFARAQRRRDAQGAEEEEGQTGPEDAPPSLPLEGYAGTYADSLNGRVEVTFEGGVLHLAWEDHPGFAARLEPWRYNAFRVVDWESAGVLAPLASSATFQIDRDGRATALEVSMLGTFGRVAGEGGDGGGPPPT